ncbi:unnamed protein product [Owenia fusiformis]|uniref:Guided entry of tail-anchored proteins factor 1 n=1 Tax=Owenia fusiformis TaxID=6347 RepID=A0A8J1XJK2_OWEFU|nr:unnamed protein product [Owenia fusiformis]
MLLFVAFSLVLLFSFIPIIVPPITKLIVLAIKKVDEDEIKTRQELKNLKEELGTFSAMDEFARHAKIQRKINKLMEEVQKHTKTRSDVFVAVKMLVSGVLKAIQIIISLSLIITYRADPVIMLPLDWVTPWPLWKILAFPTGIEGAVGLTFWLIVCRSVVSQSHRLFGKS